MNKINSKNDKEKNDIKPISSFNAEKIADSPIPIKRDDKKDRINLERYKVEIPLVKSEIEPIWVSVSEAAKFGGIQDKTIRRAIQSNLITYKVVNNRYQIDFGSVVRYLYTSTKLKNKIKNDGVGKYIDKWKE